VRKKLHRIGNRFSRFLGEDLRICDELPVDLRWQVE
jgi:hypothetical protein